MNDLVIESYGLTLVVAVVPAPPADDVLPVKKFVSVFIVLLELNCVKLELDVVGPNVPPVEPPDEPPDTPPPPATLRIGFPVTAAYAVFALSEEERANCDGISAANVGSGVMHKLAASPRPVPMAVC